MAGISKAGTRRINATYNGEPRKGFTLIHTRYPTGQPDLT